MSARPARKSIVPANRGPHPLPEGWNLSHGVKVGDVLYISGQGSFDESLEIVGEGDPEAQMRQIWSNVQTIVEAAGGKVTDVVSVRTYVDDPALIDVVQAVRPEFFPDGDYPASIDLVVAKPSMPGLLFEMEAVAVIGCS